MNRIFKQTMFQNLHFFIKDSTGTTNEYYSENISYALNLAFNNNTNVIEIQSYRIDIDTFPPANYTIPTNTAFVVSTARSCIYFLSSIVGSLRGFSSLHCCSKANIV